MLCPTAIVILIMAGTIQPWMIIVLSVVVGVTDALSMPSFQSIVPSIVARKDIGPGLALNSTQFNLSRILGPSLAGVLMSSVGTMACFVVSAVSYVPFIGVALWILPRRSSPPKDVDAPTWTQSFAGIGAILGQRQLRGALLTVFITGVFCAPLVTFSPVLVKEVFKGGAGDFSLAVASFGIGGLIGAAALLSIPASIDRRRMIAGLGGVHGLILLVAAINPWFSVLPVLLALAGAAMTMSNTAANALIQATAGSLVLGRAVSLYMLAMRGGISIGALLTGASVSVFGVQHALLFNGAIAVLLQAGVASAWLRASMPSNSMQNS
jgi:predicted MFS family arabinose efflux permease